MLYRLGYVLLCLLLIGWAAFGAGPGDSPAKPFRPRDPNCPTTCGCGCGVGKSCPCDPLHNFTVKELREIDPWYRENEYREPVSGAATPRRSHAPPVTIQDNLPPRAPPVRPERDVDKDYRSFFRLVGANGRGVLIVGNANPHLTRYEDVLRVPSGYFGPDVKDGTYLCFVTPAGQYMEDYREGGAAVPASPFPTTPPIPAPSAVVPSSSLAGAAPFRGPILTLVRPATRGGTTTVNCRT